MCKIAWVLLGASAGLMLVSCNSSDDPGSAVAANTAPVATNVEVSTNQGQPVSGTLVAADADGDALSFSIDTSTPNLSKGDIVMDDATSGDFTYTPLPQETGATTYTFNANDGQADSNDAILTVTVNPTAVGVWIGESVSAASGQAVGMVAIVAADGQVDFLLDDSSLYAGTLQSTGMAATGALTAYAAPGTMFPDGSTIGALALDGMVETGSRFTGTYAGVGDSSSFTLDYDAAIHELVPALVDLEAVWSLSEPSGYTMDLSFDDMGTLSGGDSDGCQYDGSAAVVSPVTNVYRLAVTITSCGDRDGSYTGLASVAPKDANPAIRCLSCEMTILFGISNQTHALVRRLES